MNRQLMLWVVAAGCVSVQQASLAADTNTTAAAPVTKVEKVVVRADAQFDFDRDTVKAEDQEKILSELGKVGQVAWQSVNAVGYTDSVGSVRYNKALSERRARAVKAYLVSKGVAPSMIATSGRAEQDPVASNESAEGRAKNRRTAIEFQGVKTVENK